MTRATRSHGPRYVPRWQPRQRFVSIPSRRRSAQCSMASTSAGHHRRRCQTLHDAVVTHGVVVMRNQRIDDDQQLALARHWGELQVYAPFRCAGMDVPLEWVEDNEASPPKAFRWHSDIPWEPRPPKFGMLSAKVVPDAGGDTMWADTAAGVRRALAHDAATAARPAGALQDRGGRDGTHRRPRRRRVGARFRAAYAQGVDHPLVRRNPDSDRVALFMAGYWMDHIVGMHRDESDALLRFLHDHTRAAPVPVPLALGRRRPRRVGRTAHDAPRAARPLSTAPQAAPLHRGRRSAPRFDTDLTYGRPSLIISTYGKD